MALTKLMLDRVACYDHAASAYISVIAERATEDASGPRQS